MRFRAILLGVLGLSALGMPRHAAALTILAAAEGQVGAVARSDVAGPAGSGEVQATAAFPEAWNLGLVEPGIAQAAQNDGGNSAVVVDGACRDDEIVRLLARTSWSETVTNQGNTPVEYVYEFFVIPARLTLMDRFGTTRLGATARYEIKVRLDGNVIFWSTAELTGGVVSHTLREKGTDMGGTFFSDPAGGTLGYQFSRYDGVLSLGFYDPGESLSVETTLEAYASAPQEGLGARAEIGDPQDIGGDPGVRGAIIVSGPIGVEPATWSGIKSLYGGAGR